MAYNKTDWDENTPINVPNLQNIEDGIESVVDNLADHKQQHENGGTDEINLEDLQGESAELKNHKLDTAFDDVHNLITDGMVILETGSNQDGEWIKFSNGLAIATRETGPIATNAGGRFDYPFPIEFDSVIYHNISGPSTWITPFESTTNKARSNVFTGQSSTQWVVVKYDTAGTTNDTEVTYRLFALGTFTGEV